MGPAEEDAAQDQPQHPLGVGLGIGQAQGRAPGAAKQYPLVHHQGYADLLHILDQGLGGIALKLRVGAGSATAALIEEDDAIAFRVKKAAVPGLGTGTGPAMDE